MNGQAKYYILSILLLCIVCFVIAYYFKGEHVDVDAIVMGKAVSLRDLATEEVKNNIYIDVKDEVYQRLKDTLIKQLVEKYKIRVSKDEIKETIRQLADQEWQMLGNTEEERLQTLQERNEHALKIIKLLKEWKVASDQSYEQWKERFEALKFNRDLWEEYTDPAKYHDILKYLESVSTYDKKQFYEDRRTHAIWETKNKALKKVLVPSISVSDRSIELLFELVKNTKRIELELIIGEKRNLRQLQNDPTNKDIPVLSRQIIELDSSEISFQNDFLLKLMAQHFAVLSKGTRSEIFLTKAPMEWRHALLHIVDIIPQKAKINSTLSSLQKERVREMLYHFQKDNGFNLKIDRLLVKESKIYAPEFKDILNDLFP